MEVKPIIKDDFIVLDENQTISEMIGKMKNFEKRTGLVFRNKKYVGLVEKKKLLKLKVDSSETKIKSLVQGTPILNENADIIETAHLMYESNLSYVPVEKNKKIIGVLDALDLVKIATKLPEAKKIKISDIKLIKPAKVNKDAPLSTAISVMYKERIDQVPLFDKGKIYGIISFRDFLRKYLNWSPKRNFSAKFNVSASSRSATANMPKIANLPVSNYSTNENLLMSTPEESLVNATKLMSKNRVYDLLISKDNEYLGMLTVKSILKKIGSLKVQKDFNIKFVGLTKTKLVAHQKYVLRKISNNEAFKLQRKIKDNFNLTVHIKEYEKDGGRQKYSIHLHIDAPKVSLNVGQEDWDFDIALRKAFNNAKNSLKR